MCCIRILVGVDSNKDIPAHQDFQPKYATRFFPMAGLGILLLCLPFNCRYLDLDGLSFQACPRNGIFPWTPHAVPVLQVCDSFL